MELAIHPLPQFVFFAWCLVNHRDTITFTFTFYHRADRSLQFTGTAVKVDLGECCSFKIIYEMKVAYKQEVSGRT